MAGAGTVLKEAYAALNRGEAEAAVEQFEAACSRERSGAALEGLARAHYVRTDYLNRPGFCRGSV